MAETPLSLVVNYCRSQREGGDGRYARIQVATVYPATLAGGGGTYTVKKG
jgi:hypothetical protein